MMNCRFLIPVEARDLVEPLLPEGATWEALYDLSPGGRRTTHWFIIVEGNLYMLASSIQGVCPTVKVNPEGSGGMVKA